MAENTSKVLSIAVLGGTGKAGFGLVLRWAQSGYRVFIGSRDATKAASAANDANQTLGDELVQGLENPEAAAQADVLVLSVPYAAHKPILESVKEAAQGKILIDMTVPLLPPNIRTVNVPEGKAASLEAQALLGDGVRVVAAFQNVSASHLKALTHSVNCDVLVCGDNDEAKTEVSQLVAAIQGMRAIDAGPLANAVAVEALTPVLLHINKRYQVKGAGLRITGLE